MTDWAQIRAEYEAGSGFRALARQHGISHVAVMKRCKDEGWSRGNQDVGGNQEIKGAGNQGGNHQDVLVFLRDPQAGQFMCLWCGEQSDDLTGHMCERKKRVGNDLRFRVLNERGDIETWAGEPAEQDAWARTVAWIRGNYKDPTPEQLAVMPAMKTVDERIEAARSYHDWHLREFGRAPVVGGRLGA